MKVNWNAIFEIAKEILDFAKQVAEFAEGLEGLSRAEKIDRCTEVAADYGDARIKLPWGFEALDGPALRLALKPWVTQVIDRLYPETPPAK